MTFDFARARVNMVENQVRTNDVTDIAVQDAMYATPRERFCAADKAVLAYAEAPVPYADGLYLAEPRDVSKLLQAILPRAGEKALAIGAPYAAAVLAKIGCRTTARLTPAGAQAVGDALRAADVNVEEGDLASAGEGGPYDIIICEGGVTTLPTAWGEALAIGGRLAAVERSGPGGKAQLVLRGPDGLLGRRTLFDSTPPLLPGFERKRAFSF
jgi:protein-L-isoaspartate(D-aspartate) O-methyltransferase